MSKIFTCAECGVTFESERNDEEAKEEARNLFPGLNVDDPNQVDIVCDDCWEKYIHG